MAGTRALIRVLAAAALAAVIGLAHAADGPRTPVPKPPKAAQGAECVEPVADMRRNHMIYLEHERDETVHKGIRGRKHSLKGCVECHAVPDPVAAGARTVRPFCAECHRYVAVRIDCFGCHAQTPETRAGLPAEAKR
jgi:hypothetical protein